MKKAETLMTANRKTIKETTILARTTNHKQLRIKERRLGASFFADISKEAINTRTKFVWFRHYGLIEYKIQLLSWEEGGLMFLRVVFAFLT